MASDFQSAVIKTVQGIGYLSTFILSLVITIPMSMNQDQFKGRCLLFSTGQWQEMDGQFVVQWASQAYCNFTIFVAVIMFVISVIQFARFVKFLRRGRDSSFFSAFVDVLVCVVMVIFVLIAGCFTSVGFKVWCDEMEQRFPTCSEAGGSNIDKADGIDSSGFFFQMSVANFGIWVSFTMWIILLTFSLVKLCRYHQEENLRVSMAKERKRLLNEDLVSEVPVNTSYHEHNRSRRSRRNQGAGSSSGHNRGDDNDERFQEITAQANIEFPIMPITPKRTPMCTPTSTPRRTPIGTPVLTLKGTSTPIRTPIGTPVLTLKGTYILDLPMRSPMLSNRISWTPLENSTILYTER